MLKIYVLIFKKTLILKTIILTYVCKHTHSHTHTYHTYIHIFMYIYTHTHTHTYRSHIYTHMHVYIYTYRSHILHTCMCVYINMYIYTCTSIYICVCVGVCGCVCVYIHTYIYTPSTPRCRWCRPPAPLAGDPHPRATTAASSAQGELAKKNSKEILDSQSPSDDNGIISARRAGKKKNCIVSPLVHLLYKVTRRGLCRIWTGVARLLLSPKCAVQPTHTRTHTHTHSTYIIYIYIYIYI